MKGIIRFIGEVGFGKNEYYGVQLETAHSDGNNGSFNKHNPSRRFFYCKEGHGLFLKKSDMKIDSKRKILKKNNRISYNDRIRVFGRGCGTVKFIGPLQHLTNTKFIYYGIDLDEAKGRHDGMCRKIRYFRCKPQHGLFVTASQIRLQKARPSM